MRKRRVAPYPTRPTRPLEHSHCIAKPTRTVRVHCEHLLMWSECTGRTRRSGRSVYTGNPTRTVRERFARRVKLPVCTRPKTCRPIMMSLVFETFSRGIVQLLFHISLVQSLIRIVLGNRSCTYSFSNRSCT